MATGDMLDLGHMRRKRLAHHCLRSLTVDGHRTVGEAHEQVVAYDLEAAHGQVIVTRCHYRMPAAAPKGLAAAGSCARATSELTGGD